MAQIFLSYRRANKDAAQQQQVAAYLISQGYDVWWDVDLLAGQHFAKDIERIIDESKATIVLWSERAVESNFVRAEARRALDQNKLIPCRIDDVSIPIPFTEIHTAQLLFFGGKIENLDDISDALRAKNIFPLGKPITRESAHSIVNSDRDEWRLHWESIRGLDSAAELGKFVDLYEKTANTEIISLAKRRVTQLNKVAETGSRPGVRPKLIYRLAAILLGLLLIASLSAISINAIRFSHVVPDSGYTFSKLGSGWVTSAYITQEMADMDSEFTHPKLQTMSDPKVLKEFDISLYDVDLKLLDVNSPKAGQRVVLTGFPISNFWPKSLDGSILFQNDDRKTWTVVLDDKIEMPMGMASGIVRDEKTKQKLGVMLYHSNPTDIDGDGTKEYSYSFVAFSDVFKYITKPGNK